MMKGIPKISILWDFHVKVALDYQKCFCNHCAEILKIWWTTSSVLQFIKTSKVLLSQMLRQGADTLGVKKILMINSHTSYYKTVTDLRVALGPTWPFFFSVHNYLWRTFAFTAEKILLVMLYQFWYDLLIQHTVVQWPIGCY